MDKIIAQIVQVAAYRVWQGTVKCRSPLVKLLSHTVYRDLAVRYGEVWSNQVFGEYVKACRA